MGVVPPRRGRLVADMTLAMRRPHDLLTGSAQHGLAVVVDLVLARVGAHDADGPDVLAHVALHALDAVDGTHAGAEGDLLAEAHADLLVVVAGGRGVARDADVDEVARRAARARGGARVLDAEGHLLAHGE